MKALAALLTISLLSSCALLKAPAQLLKAGARTFGISQNEASPAAPNPSAHVALQATTVEARD